MVWRGGGVAGGRSGHPGRQPRSAPRGEAGPPGLQAASGPEGRAGSPRELARLADTGMEKAALNLYWDPLPQCGLAALAALAAGGIPSLSPLPAVQQSGPVRRAETTQPRRNLDQLNSTITKGAGRASRLEGRGRPGRARCLRATKSDLP